MPDDLELVTKQIAASSTRRRGAPKLNKQTAANLMDESTKGGGDEGDDGGGGDDNGGGNGNGANGNGGNGNGGNGNGGHNGGGNGHEDGHKCRLRKKWIHLGTSISVQPTGTVHRFHCDPLLMRVEADDEHALTLKCSCEGESISNVVMPCTVLYGWKIISGGGRFVEITDAPGSDHANAMHVMYHPPALTPGQSKTVKIEVSAAHGDSSKPPDHAPAKAEIKLEITREIKSYTTPPGTTPIEYEADEDIYEITVTPSPVQGTPLPKETSAGDCLPGTSWLQNSPISGDIAPLTADIWTKEYVILRIENQSDTDMLRLQCDPDEGSDCVGSSEDLILNDVIGVEWMCDFGEFPMGSTGIDVIWEAPLDDKTVLITAVIHDSGKQYVDHSRTVRKQIQVKKLERRATFAVVGFVDQNDPNISTLPEATANPPAANPDWTKPWDAPLYVESLKSGTAAGSTKYGYSFFDPGLGTKEWNLMQWLAAVQNWDRESAFHPWYHGCDGLLGSANPTPPLQFAALSALQTWMTGKEYRVVVAGKVRALVRRGKIIHAALEDTIIDQGWTPIRKYFLGIHMTWLAKFQAWVLARMSLEDYERGDQRNLKIKWTSVCEETITLALMQDVRIGAKGNQLQGYMTNRDAPWISVAVRFSLHANADPTKQDLQVSAKPEFPTYFLYFGEPLDEFESLRCELQIKFIDRGAKLSPNGV